MPTPVLSDPSLLPYGLPGSGRGREEGKRGVVPFTEGSFCPVAAAPTPLPIAVQVPMGQREETATKRQLRSGSGLSASPFSLSLPPMCTHCPGEEKPGPLKLKHVRT